MKIFRVIVVVVVVFLGSMMAIHPQQVSARIVSPPYMAAYYIVAAPYKEPATVIVKYGETLTSIASSTHTTWESVYCDNKKLIGNNPNEIKPGERLSIPVKKTTCHIVTPDIPASPVTAYSSPVNVVSYAPQEPLGSLQSYALSLLDGNLTQYQCLNDIIMTESSWNVYAANATSGAYGIPQALPGNKMAVAGSDWETDGDTQLRWMIDDYIPPAYGTPCNAWSHEQSFGYY